mmetsp:Transcript_27364/g.54831  ORF Transcript_27364/g.54831 Transcript_27364/m.54831 type:complete len:513 (+) Transcript_27364:40-1578(+)
MTTTTPPPPPSTATYESEEDRSLLFSDSEQESSQAGDADDTQDDNNLQWEDFMTRYWSNNNHDNNNNELQITANANRILMMEDTDMVPHPLEPELDIHNPISSSSLSDAPLLEDVAAADNMALSKVLSEVGLESTLQMAKLHPSASADHHYHYSKSTVKKKEAESTKSRQTKKMMKQQLIEEFAIDMANVPITSSSSLSTVANSKSKQKKRTSKDAASSLQVSQEIMSSPGKSGSTNYQQQSSSFAMMQPTLTSSPRQQEDTPLEDSLLAMAKRLSPGNDAPQKQQQQQAQHNEQRPSQQQQQQQHHHRRQHSTSSSIIPPQSPQSSSDSPLPNPDLIHQMGPIQTRTSLRSLLMKKWHPSWWMHYDTHSLLIFRSKDHLDDWVQNPYHGKRERAYLVKLRVDFGDIVGASASGGAGAGGDGQPGGDSNNAKEGVGILGHRLLPVKKKSYNKNEPEMYQFKLERWTNMGVSVLAAFASEEEADVQLLYDTITEIMLTCPFGGLHDIDHMLKH